jgi:hypothetical protein
MQSGFIGLDLAGIVCGSCVHESPARLRVYLPHTVPPRIISWACYQSCIRPPAADMSRAYYCAAVILMAIWSSACHSDAANAPTLSASTLVFHEGDGGPGFTALYSIGSDGRNRRQLTSSGTQPSETSLMSRAGRQTAHY